MSKTLLITGSTDGIGLEAAKTLTELGHRVLLHGRSVAKLEAARQVLAELGGEGPVEGYVADLSTMAQVESLAAEVAEKHDHLDVLVNNAGVFKTPKPVTADGLDVRFVVNTLAPVLLTRRLLPLLGPSGRILNLSSAAQQTVDLRALAGEGQLSDFAAYGQSKLAITAWSRWLARQLGEAGPTVYSVNPGSMLASKMVRQGFGVAGRDIGIGAEILARLALEEPLAPSGSYFDNDAGQFGAPHPDALDAAKTGTLMTAIDGILAELSAR